ncbi:MAG: adenylyl-sulfate kinase [Candidatus Omnitrophica bacterium]|nr:adenylyl-sulfate kinase [Candidatus Omnitrophota bacterium]
MELAVKDRDTFSVVFTGHVDHGKSTVLGRLLADSGALPQGKLESVRETCRLNSRPFEYAFLIDALKDEQSQGITIDSARVFFKTKKRDYIVIDAPGHVEFIRNMVTGASRADAAFLVIDALEGVRENSKRHGYLLGVLGIKTIVVIVNKMDLVSFDRSRFEAVKSEFSGFLDKVGLVPVSFIPASGLMGDNVTVRSEKTPWYGGRTVLESLDGFDGIPVLTEGPFRMPVQDVYKFTKFGDSRRIVAGRVVSGSVKAGDEIVFLPSGKCARLKSIETFNSAPKLEASAGDSPGFTLAEEIYVKRGEIAVKKEGPRPNVTSRLRASVFWLSESPMVKDKEYTLKLGTARGSAVLESIDKIFDPEDLDKDTGENSLLRNKVGECVIKLKRPMSFDIVSDIRETSRFVLVSDNNIAGGGIILEPLKDKQSWSRDKVIQRDIKWEKSAIPYRLRHRRYGQKPWLIVVTGEKDAARKTIAKKLEEDLFSEGKIVYFLGMVNVLYGVDADIKGAGNDKEEHIRRLAEVSHIMIDAGMILIVTAIEFSREDIDLIRTSVESDNITVIWVGNKVTTDIEPDLVIERPEDVENSVGKIRRHLAEKNALEYDEE